MNDIEKKLEAIEKRLEEKQNEKGFDMLEKLVAVFVSFSSLLYLFFVLKGGVSTSTISESGVVGFTQSFLITMCFAGILANLGYIHFHRKFRFPRKYFTIYPEHIANNEGKMIAILPILSFVVFYQFVTSIFFCI
ncbi:MAG: hypothetical protein JJE19_02790 [Methanosarcinales archaeon]|nr:hypothetical protein [Methanosarcinales archaeon]